VKLDDGGPVVGGTPLQSPDDSSNHKPRFAHACKEREPKQKTKGVVKMPRYVIERNWPGASNMSEEEIRSFSQKSKDAIEELGPQIQWLETYLTPDKMYCVFIAPDAEIIKKHSQEAGFPLDMIEEVKKIVDPTTAEL
jgi:hypothetical protein